MAGSFTKRARVATFAAAVTALAAFAVPLTVAQADTTLQSLAAAKGKYFGSATDNPELTEVDLGALQTVDSLAVHLNTLLDPTDLRNVRTFESEFSFNADDPPPAP